MVMEWTKMNKLCWIISIISVILVVAGWTIIILVLTGVII